MFLQQVRKTQDRALIWKILFARIQIRKLAKQAGVVYRFFPPRI